jgi:hypothetical protein
MVSAISSSNEYDHADTARSQVTCTALLACRDHTDPQETH